QFTVPVSIPHRPQTPIQPHTLSSVCRSSCKLYPNESLLHLLHSLPCAALWYFHNPCSPRTRSRAKALPGRARYSGGPASFPAVPMDLAPMRPQAKIQNLSRQSQRSQQTIPTLKSSSSGRHAGGTSFTATHSMDVATLIPGIPAVTSVAVHQDITAAVSWEVLEVLDILEDLILNCAQLVAALTVEPLILDPQLLDISRYWIGGFLSSSGLWRVLDIWDYWMDSLSGSSDRGITNNFSLSYWISP
ncbi:hypothetical protein BDZ91DRAFT_822287, partial [Kalaharituber pfeilii]